MVNASGRLADGDYSARVEGSTGMLTPVANSFNRMAERLEKADDDRRRLLADLGHELGTPLSVIRGNVEALIDGVHPTDPAHLSALLEEVETMERLLEDLRTLSLSEAGRLELHKEPTDPSALVSEVVSAFAASADQQLIDLSATSLANVEECQIDPVRVRQILSNLVANALANTPSGGAVTVMVDVLESGGTKWSVADNGRGMEVEQLAHVFERFVKGADSKGSGLGLTIARDLVEAHGGHIEASSQPGKGTTVFFSLPG